MQISAIGAHDEQLGLSFLGGDKEAYAEIYKAHFGMLYDYGMKICRNAELVKDCIQDLFVKLWVNREGLKPANSIKPYLYTALRGAVLNKLDQAGRAAKREGCASQINSFDVHYTIEESLIHSDEESARKRQILKALNNLTTRQKESIFPRFYIGLEYVEIADIMQISVKASYKIIGRAIDVMRKYFKEMPIYGFLLFLLYIIV